MRAVTFIMTIIVMFTLAACGGGGGSTGGSTSGSASSTGTLKLVCSGSLTKNLAGISITVPLPVGVTVATDAAGKVLSTAIVPSGITANAASIVPELTVYNAPSDSVAGSLAFVLVSSANAGFGAGEFASITVTVAAGASPPSGSIAAGSFKAVDISGANVSGLTAVIQ